MYCNRCGRQNADGATFCAACGQPFGAAPAVTGAGNSGGRKPSKGLVLALVAVLVIVGLVGGFLFLEMTKTTLGAEMTGKDWEYATVSKYDGEYVVRRAHASDPGDCKDIWESVSQLKIRASKSDLSDRMEGEPYHSLTLFANDFQDVIYLEVTSGGVVCVYGDTPEFYTGGKALYRALETFLPEGDRISLDDCIPDRKWDAMSIYYYNPDGSIYAEAYTTDSAAIARAVGRLEDIELKYGGGTYDGYVGYTARLMLHSDDEYYSLFSYADGNADVMAGDWTYGAYDAVILYDIFWEELAQINGW